jgi:hypothetical protein
MLAEVQRQHRLQLVRVPRPPAPWVRAELAAVQVAEPGEAQAEEPAAAADKARDEFAIGNRAPIIAVADRRGLASGL